MLGAIVGDVVGSSREFAPIKSKEFELFEEASIYTDDTILTIAVASAIADGAPIAQRLKEYANAFVSTYGPRFWDWVASSSMEPYGSWGNGAAMRVSPAAWLGRDLLHCLELARASAVATHDHPEAVRGAEATALAIYLARAGYTAAEIGEVVTSKSGYDLSRSVDQVRSTCIFETKSWVSVPEALICALQATSFEDALRNAVSIGGDADTQAVIAGSVAEPLFGVPGDIASKALSLVPPRVRELYLAMRGRIVPVVDPTAQLDMVPVWDPQLRVAFEQEAQDRDRAAQQESAYFEQLEASLSAAWQREGFASKVDRAVRNAVSALQKRLWRSEGGRLAQPRAPAEITDPSAPSKLSVTKLKWAEEGRFLTGRVSDPSTDRLPPGQHLTEAWPILDLGPKPYIDLASWQLEISEVDAPRSLTWREILALPQTKATSDIHCVTSWSRFDNHWEGISTRELIDLVQVRPAARYVRLTSCDGYTTNLTIDDFARDGGLLAHGWDGRPLAREHGAPLRLVVPHLYFWKSAKWLKAIAFTEADEPGYWETKGYHNVGDPWREQRYKRS